MEKFEKISEFLKQFTEEDSNAKILRTVNKVASDLYEKANAKNKRQITKLQNERTKIENRSKEIEVELAKLTGGKPVEPVKPKKTQKPKEPKAKE